MNYFLMLLCKQPHGKPELGLQAISLQQVDFLVRIKGKNVSKIKLVISRKSIFSIVGTNITCTE